jgi:ABC-type Fe3+ transport system substrate-binding protein
MKAKAFGGGNMLGTLARTVALACAIALAASSACAADSPYYEKAKQEGQVNWYTTLIIDTAVIPLTTAFEKRYPGVKVFYSRADSTPTVLKIVNEAKAGKMQADVTDGTGTSPPLRKAGLLAPYKPMNWDAFPPQLKDPDGYWTANILYFQTAAINTDMVKGADVPKKLEDLLNPKWKGSKIAWSTSTAGGAAFIGGVLAGLGEEKGMDFLRKLSKQQVVNLGISARAVVDKIDEGEYPIALGIFNHHTVMDAAKGAPVTWLPIEPILAPLSVESVVKDSPHPNAARLFVDFLMSEDAAHVLADVGFLPALPSVPAKTPTLKPEGGFFKAIFASPEFVADNLAKWQKIRKELFE